MITLRDVTAGLVLASLSFVFVSPAIGQSEDSPSAQTTDERAVLTSEDGLFDVAGFGQAKIEMSRLPSSHAYRSSVGYYLAGASGRPIHGKIIWRDAREGVRTTIVVDLNRWPEAEKLGFFLVPDGAARNQTLRDLDIVDLSLSRDRWVAFRDGKRLAGRNDPIYFSDWRLNPESRPQAAIDSKAGTLNWAERPVAEDPRFSNLQTRLSVSASKQPQLLIVGEGQRTDDSIERLAELEPDQSMTAAPPVALERAEPPPSTQKQATPSTTEGDTRPFAFDIADAESVTIDLKPYSSDTGFRNSFGYYLKDKSGRPYRGRVIWADTSDQTIGTIVQIDRRGLGKAHGLGFFIIPDGATLNPQLRDGAKVGIAKYVNEWTVVLDGISLNGASHPAFFSEPQFNADGVDHMIDGPAPGNFNWEDEFRGGNNSFDDVNIDVVVTVDIGSGRGSEDLLVALPDGPEGAVATPITPPFPSEPTETASVPVPGAPVDPADDATAPAKTLEASDDQFWGEPVFSGFGEAEISVFPESPQFDRQSDEWLQQSIAGSFEYAQDAGARGEVLLELFGRYDQIDDQRSYIDIQQAHVAYFGDLLTLRAGVLNETWGVLELENIVDIVNQRNLAEDFRADAKLGQPGIKLGFPIFSFGQADLYYLPYPRRRPFVGNEGRFQIAAIPVADNDTFYESAAEDDRERWAKQAAGRLQFFFGDLEAAISHFYGTSRDPQFDIVLDGATPVALSPIYSQINQSGIELRAIALGNVLKAEAFRRTGQDPFEEIDAFYGAAAGIEREFVRVFDSDLGLTMFGEYYFDNRGFTTDAVAPAPLDNDAFVGGRLAFNDLADTQFLLTSTIDLDTQATLLALELQRRIGNNLQLTLRGDTFINAGDDPAETALQDDHRILLRARYFY